MAFITFNQVLQMFLYMLIGYALFKCNMITEEGSRSIANLLIFVVIPTVIIKSLCIPFDKGKFADIVVSIIVGILALLISLTVSKIIFRHDDLSNFGASFSNAGFFGIPLITAVIGESYVPYMLGILLSINIVQWTYGVYLLTNDKSKIKPKKILLNQFSISAITGITIFILNIADSIPPIIYSTISGISLLNAPLAMIILGGYLAQADIKELITIPRYYKLSIVRLFIIPIITLMIFAALPVSKDILMVVFIVASVPIGSNLAIYAQMFNKDYRFGCLAVTQSTLLCIISLPLIIGLAQTIL